MTSARDEVQKALVARISAYAGMPVKVSPVVDLPYVRVGDDTERPDAPNKDGDASAVQTLVSVFSESYAQARQVCTAIMNDLLDPDSVLAVTGFRVLSVRLDLAVSVPEYDSARTVYGERAGFLIITEPSS